MFRPTFWWLICLLAVHHCQKPLAKDEFYFGYSSAASSLAEPNGCFLHVGNAKTKKYDLKFAMRAATKRPEIKPKDFILCGIFLENMVVDSWGNILTFAGTDFLQVYRMTFGTNNTYQPPTEEDALITMDVALDGIMVSQNHLFVVGNDGECPGKCVYQYGFSNQTITESFLIMDLDMNMYYLDSAVSARFLYILHIRDKTWIITRWNMGSWEDSPMELIVRKYVSDSPQGRLFVRDRIVYILLIDDIECFVFVVDHDLGKLQPLWEEHHDIVGMQDIFTVDFTTAWYALVRNETEGVYSVGLDKNITDYVKVLDLPNDCRESPHCDIKSLIPIIPLPITVEFSKYRDRLSLPTSIVWGLLAVAFLLLCLAVYRYMKQDRSGSFFWGKYRLFTSMPDYDFKEQDKDSFMQHASYEAPDLVEPVPESATTEEDLRNRRDLL